MQYVLRCKLHMVLNKSEYDRKYEEWQKKVKNLPKKDLGTNLTHKPLYGPFDFELDYEKDLSFPGTYPFTRGVYPTMYLGRKWTMRQYSGFGTAEETNKRFLFLLSQGQTGLSVAFDLPTQIGLDSDDSMSRGEVGKTGVAIDSLEDMEILFRDIPLDKVSTSMTINSTAAILLCLYIAVAEKNGIAMNQLRGTIQNDLLKEYIARGTYIYPPTQSMRLIINIFEFCAKNVPNWNTISISGYHIREAGSTAAQEVAFTIANAISYVRSAIKAGLNPNEFGKRLSFFFNSHNNFLEEVAKFRAARRIWAKIMKEKFQVTDEKAQMLRFHTQTGGSTLTAQQPYNNAIRVAYQALAAVLGGTQSLHTNSLDEALALPTEETAQLALRTQQVLAYETGVSDIIDPLAGSYYVESLTNKIEIEVNKYLDTIESVYGGMVKAIENGYPQREIHNSAFLYQKQVENLEKTIVGVNKFQGDTEPISLLRIDEKIEKNQVEKLKRLKSSRDTKLVEKCLQDLKISAENPEVNVIPNILECVKNYCTIGEISNILRTVWGEYQAPDIF